MVLIKYINNRYKFVLGHILLEIPITFMIFNNQLIFLCFINIIKVELFNLVTPHNVFWASFVSQRHFASSNQQQFRIPPFQKFLKKLPRALVPLITRSRNGVLSNTVCVCIIFIRTNYDMRYALHQSPIIYVTG